MHRNPATRNQFLRVRNLHAIVSFDIRKVFDAATAPVMERYFSKQIDAAQACKELHWPQSVWERAMSGIINAVRNNENLGHIATLSDEEAT